MLAIETGKNYTRGLLVIEIHVHGRNSTLLSGFVSERILPPSLDRHITNPQIAILKFYIMLAKFFAWLNLYRNLRPFLSIILSL